MANNDIRMRVLLNGYGNGDRDGVKGSPPPRPPWIIPLFNILCGICRHLEK